METLKFILNPRLSTYHGLESKVCAEHVFSWGNVNPNGIRACYDEGKRVAETLTYGFHRQDGVDVRIARIFNTFGTRTLCILFLHHMLMLSSLFSSSNKVQEVRLIDLHFSSVMFGY